LNLNNQKLWVIHTPDPEHARAISDSLGCSPIIGQILINRGLQNVEHASTFFNPSLDGLHDPFLIDDMSTAVDRVKYAIEHNEKILVFGDYDVDGMAGTALLVRELDSLSCPTYYYIPNRLIEGYGLNKEQVSNAHENGVKLIITVDNGISCHEETELAASLGMDVIICDHHEPEGVLPRAHAVLNPKRTDSSYPFRDLSGAGVAFKFLSALLGRLPENLDFAALGTVADIVPLFDENRILAKAGLEMINDKENLSPGLSELLKVSGLDGRKIGSGNIAFQLAPRLNAAGRLGVGQLGVQLLLTTSQALAQRLARKLDEENRNRQGIENDILQQALAKLDKEFDPQRDFSIVLSDTRWHPGVTGIVASRLMEKYQRPVILIAMGDEVGKGSARSIHQFHIYNALSSCKEYLVTFGGHKYAAGLTIERSKLDEYKSAFERLCREQLADEDLRPVVRADSEVQLSDITPPLLEELEKLAPHGSANPVPIFASIGVTGAGSLRILQGEHLKFAVRQSGKTIPVIGFKMAEYESVLANSDKIDILYTPQFNTYKGVTSIQLSIRDIRPHHE